MFWSEAGPMSDHPVQQTKMYVVELFFFKHVPHQSIHLEVSGAIDTRFTHTTGYT